MRVDLALAKQQLRVDHPDEDTLIGVMISAAARRIENYIGTPLLARDEIFRFKSFGSSLDLHLGPLNSVGNIAYVDQDGQAQTLDEHRIVGESVYPEEGESFPSTLNPSEIVVTANVGYEEDDDLPESIMQAQLLLLVHYYDNREAVVTGTIATELPLGVADLLQEFRSDLA